VTANVPLSGVKILKNDFDDCLFDDVVGFVSGSLISGNQFRHDSGTPRSNIELFPAVSNDTVSANTFNSSVAVRDGAVVVVGGTSVQILGNSFQGGAASIAQSTKVKVDNNTFGVTQTGVHFQGAVTGSEIVGNTFTGQGATGPFGIILDEGLVA